jgi:hypothetical protein
MATQIFHQIRTALHHLDPQEVRQLVTRPFTIGLRAVNGDGMARMEDFLVPPEVSSRQRTKLNGILYRSGDPGAPEHFTIEICEEGAPPVPGAFVFRSQDPEHTVREVLAEHQDLALALARYFPPFRRAVTENTIHEISQQNSLFALLTALPDAIPSLFELGWAAGEFASDTVVLTVNQVRMAFLIAAASDYSVGYLEQKAQIASIIAGAFGWRGLARELAGKIPFGGGLIPKAAIAYAGTYVVGLSLERYYRIGYGYTRAERRVAYEEAFERGKTLARSLLESVRTRNGN